VALGALSSGAGEGDPLRLAPLIESLGRSQTVAQQVKALDDYKLWLRVRAGHLFSLSLCDRLGATKGISGLEPL
jgi:hypothetical protein